MEIKNEKLKKTLFKIIDALKKTALVFNGEFSIPAAFSALLFFLILPIIIVENFKGGTYDKYKYLSDAFQKLSLSCFAGIVAASISVFFTKKKWLNAICGAAGFGIARLLILLGENKSGFMIEYFGFLIILVVMFMFAIYSGQKKDEALLYVFAKFVQSIIIANFISLGFLLCEALFCHFVINNFEVFSEWVMPITYSFCICIVGLFYFFANICTDSTKNPPLSKMEKGWYHYCMLIIFTVYIFVLYVYFIKIIFVRTLPEGLIGYFVSIAAAAYLFMYFSQKQFNDTWTKWFYKIGAYVMLPLIVMQCLAIYQRISAYGLTGTRICNIGYVLIVLVFIALAICKNGMHVRKIFPFAAAVVFILTIQPFNAQKIAIMQQTAHFERLLIKNGIWNKKTLVLTPLASVDDVDKDELNSIWSIYDYLKGKKTLPDYCKDKEFSEAFGFSKKYRKGGTFELAAEFKSYNWNAGYFHAIDTENYSRARFEEYRYDGWDNANERIRINVCKINKYGQVDYFYDFDITDFIIENLLAIESNAESFVMRIDDNTSVAFTKISFEYDETKKVFRNEHFYYCVLMK